MKKLNLYNESEVREKVFNAIQKMTRLVGMTLGPAGRSVIIERGAGEPLIVDDGRRVAENIKFDDPVEQMAVRTCYGVTRKTDEKAGDGPQDLNSKILTPKGWVRMGDIKKGDNICGTNGTTQKVLEVFKKGKLEKHRVHLSGGGVVNCSDNHLWTVTINQNKGKKTVLPLSEIMKDYETINKDGTSTYKYYVETSIADFEEKELKLDPYLVGVLLGDGSLTGKGKSVIEISLGKKKKHVINKLSLPEGLRLDVKWVDNKNYFRVKILGNTPEGKNMKDFLSEIGLFGHRSDKKFIPKEYLFSSVNSRLKLLQGLIDTDGHINKRCLFEFSSTSKNLADDFADLCRSLGKQITIREKDRTNGGGYSETTVFCVTERKGYKFGNKIIKIENTGETVEMRCIKVSNEDHLYFTDGYTLTHNTTSSMILTNAIMEEVARNYISFGGMVGVTTNVNEVDKKLQEAKNTVLSLLDKKAKQIKTEKELIEVATIVSGDPKIGKIIGEMYWKLGKEGHIALEFNLLTEEIETEIASGYRFSGGYAANWMITDTIRKTATLDDVNVLIARQKDLDKDKIEGLARQVANAGKTKMVIVAPKFTPSFLKSVYDTAIKSKFVILCVRAPGRGEEAFRDMAIFTGAKYFNESDDVKLAMKEDLGYIEKIEVSDDTCIMINGAGKPTDIKKRIEEVKAEAALEKMPQFKQDRLERASALAGGVGVIRIGAPTDEERNWLKYKIEDAKHATKHAFREGVVRGGGQAFIEIAKELPEDNILKNVLYAPYEKLKENNGGEFKVGKDVIDPVAVEKAALEHAVSAASKLLRVGGAIATANKPELDEAFKGIINNEDLIEEDEGNN